MTENKDALELRNRLRPVAEKHAGEMLRDLIGPASDTAHRVATDHLLSFAQTVATPPAQDAMREALEKIATVDMGGGFFGAQACRQIAREALSTPQPQTVDDTRAALAEAIEALKEYKRDFCEDLCDGGPHFNFDCSGCRAAQVVAKYGVGW